MKAKENQSNSNIENKNDDEEYGVENNGVSEEEIKWALRQSKLWSYNIIHFFSKFK